MDGLARLAAALVAAMRPDGPALAGLCAGEAGIALALVRAGRALGDSSLVAAGLERANALTEHMPAHADFYSGNAGRLRMHLALSRCSIATASAHGAAARRLVEALAVGPPWYSPPEHGNLGGAACVGYAHGAVGVADCLLDAWLVKGDPMARATVARSVAWLRDLSLPAVPRGTGAAWPLAIGGAPRWAGWCHGSAGVARLLFRAAEHGFGDEAAELALRASYTVKSSMKWAGPSQCCGLAGATELLLDAYLATGDVRWKESAKQFGQILLAKAEVASSRRSESHWGVGWLSGLGGVVTCLLRLEEPSIAYPLSLAGMF
jgi:lantibiotic modifying enzyme